MTSKEYRWYLFRVFAVILVLFGPFAVGIFKLTVASGSILGIIIVVFAYVLRLRLGASIIDKVILLLLSVSLSVAVFDLLSRPFLERVIWVRASAMFEHRWSRLPLLHRYTPNVSYRGNMYGDLAGITGVQSDREERTETFITDACGFRNDHSCDRQDPLDLIVLGDSMADGANTAQEQTLTSIFARDYHYETRNLSMGGAGPWEEYVNLSLEIERSPIRPTGTVVLWFIFPGNDLDDPCYPIVQGEGLAWSSSYEAFMTSYSTFRARSPVRLLRLKAEYALRGFLGIRSVEAPVLRRDFMGRPILFYSDIAKRRSRQLGEILQHPNWPCIKSIFKAMKRLAETKHLKIAVVSVPSKEDVYSWVLDNTDPWSSSLETSPFSTALESASEEQGFSFIDLKPFLINGSKVSWEQSGELLWWRDDVHWNGKGQQEAALVIESTLLRPLLQRSEGKRLSKPAEAWRAGAWADGPEPKKVDHF